MKKIIMLLTIFCATISYIQAQIIVAKDGTGDYKNIQSAIDNSTSGTTITVKKGTYFENIILKNGIILVGEENPTIDGNSIGVVVKMASNSSISGFSIKNSGSASGTNDCGVLARNIDNCSIVGNFIFQNGHYGIVVHNATAKIYYNTIAANAILGIYLSDSATFDIAYNQFINHKHSCLDISSSKIKGLFYNNNIVNCGDGIIYGNDISEPFNISIFNNIFYSNNNAISCPSNFAKYIEYNCFYNNTNNYWDWSKEKTVKLSTTNIFDNPKFKDIENFDLNLNTSSPCIDAGYNNCEIGAINYPSGNEIDRSINPKFERTDAKYVIKLKGTATNHTAGNKSANISCIILSDDGVNFYSEGQYDDKVLFGHFKMTGKKTSSDNDDFLTIDFNTGDCDLGNDNSGFPICLMPHTGSITIFSDNANGKYLCGKVIPLAMTEQNGYLTFNNVQINGSLKSIITCNPKLDKTPSPAASSTTEQR